MEEVYVTVDGERIIPFMEHERSEVNVDEVIEWDKPLEEQINREEITVVSEVSVEEAFGNVDAGEKLTLSAEQIERKVKTSFVMSYELNILMNQENGSYPNFSAKKISSKHTVK